MDDVCSVELYGTVRPTVVSSFVYFRLFYTEILSIYSRGFRHTLLEFAMMKLAAQSSRMKYTAESCLATISDG
jgi:hypothetical protein